MALRYVLRVRDMVHGTIQFTKEEMDIINHPFFQRLRHVRQNDVAFYVYPSLNTSRFEHSLGACWVAGMMAESITRGPEWDAYSKNAQEKIGIASPDEFVALARLYALLHDIGHFPLSHLFEGAVEQWSTEEDIANQWTGISGYTKLHEALGAVLIKELAQEVKPRSIRGALIRLMTEKAISRADPLSVVKAIVDSDIDADRIDSTKRDGTLAGGEYGNYDIRRLCDSAFATRTSTGEWFLAFSQKALTSMEALLLDRYRIYTWVHFHHRTVSMRALVSRLIGEALERHLLDKNCFDSRDIEVFALRDDTWLWGILRAIDVQSNLMLALIRRAVFLREKRNILALWKGRLAYHLLREEVKGQMHVTNYDYAPLESYRRYIGEHLRAEVLIQSISFSPVGESEILLYSEENGSLTGNHLLSASRLVARLEEIWKIEPQLYVYLLSRGAAQREQALKRRWVNQTVQWLRLIDKEG